MTDEEIKKTVGKSITYYRVKANLKQSDLAKMINYSDKSISKWECGEGIPDVIVLTRLSEIFNISIDDFFLQKHDDYSPHKIRVKKIVPILSILLVFFVASIIFAGLTILKSYIKIDFVVPWLVFIWAIPAAAIVAIVFSKIWWNKFTFASVSTLCWSIALSFHLSLTFAYPLHRSYLAYLIAFVFQIIVILWFVMKRKPGEK